MSETHSIRTSVSRIYFTDVDLIVLCTKNPKPIIPYLKEIKKPIIFHTTIMPYKSDIEPTVKDKTEIINDVIEVSKIIGKAQKYNCVKMVDIRVYNSCENFCKYCYANFIEEKVKDNFKLHDDKSSLLVGHITKNDIIKVRK